MPEILQANKFLNRQELEDYIKAKIGMDINANKTTGHLIQGTREELAKLNLDETTSIFGIKCLASDESIIKKIDDKKAK